jgi:citrate lyase subunit beta/citryl-CoA lyase
MIEKAAASDADMGFLDLEDAVAPGEKAAARAAVVAAFRDLDWRGKPRAYRVNGLDTPFFYRDLIDVLEQAHDLIDVVIVPKVERPEDVYVVATLLRQIGQATASEHPIGIEVQIESAAGLVACERIAAASPAVASIIFGPGDYAASVGMPATMIGVPDEWDDRYPGFRWDHAMTRILVAGRAAGKRVIDGPYADVRDLDGFRRKCQVARALGYDGTWCIHPAQIAIANDVFLPTLAEIGWARRVVDAYRAATSDGFGAIAIDGRMIDAASLRMAERTLAAAGESALDD